MIRTGAANAGTFNYPIALHSRDGSRYERLEPLVDTGSLFTWVPSTLLERLRVEPEQRLTFVTANGQRLIRSLADVPIEIDGLTHNTTVVFGQAGDLSLLGAYTFERFLLMPDVVYKCLVPIRATAPANEIAGDAPYR